MRFNEKHMIRIIELLYKRILEDKIKDPQIINEVFLLCKNNEEIFEYFYQHIEQDHWGWSEPQECYGCAKPGHTKRKCPYNDQEEIGDWDIKEEKPKKQRKIEVIEISSESEEEDTEESNESESDSDDETLIAEK